MFRWNRMLRNHFGSRREQPKTQRPKPPVTMRLEVLEDRTLPSGSSLPAGFEAPPLAESALMAMRSLADSVIEPRVQQIATMVQYLSNALSTLGQELLQEVAALPLQWMHNLDINPNVQKPSFHSVVSQHDNNPSRSSTTSVRPSPQASVIPHAPAPSLRTTPRDAPPALPPPPKMYVYFDSSSYTVNENAGTVTLQVDLSYPITNTVSVELTTSDGTAQSGIDYQGVDTYVTFQPQQTSQTVNVTILDDGTGDDSAGSESFTAQLSNVSGGPLISTPSSATVTIQENSSPPPPPPPPPPPGIISGTVWLDNDDDGLLQAGEPGLPGIAVELFQYGDSWGYEGMQTDSNGHYAFVVPSGYQYAVDVYFYSPYEATIEYASSTGIVSDINEYGFSTDYTLNANGGVEIDAGLVDEAQQAPTDTLVWNPQGADNNASTVTNWWDQKLGRQLLPNDPGVSPSTPVVFDASGSVMPSSNAPINWDESFTVASITLTQYTGQMTLPSENILTVVGAINEDTDSSLNVDFGSPGSQLQVQSDTSNLYNFNFSNQQGSFIAEDTAWVNMNVGSSETSTANINVASGATIDIKGDGAGLNLRGDNTEVFVGSGGTLNLDPSGTHSLIQFGNFTTGEILENQGKVNVTCQPGVTSLITIPVLNDGGQFNVNGSGNDQTKGGSFNIFGFSSRTANANFDMTSGVLNLVNAASLTGDTYVQSGGSLQTNDAYQEVLGLGAGIAVISGGKIVLDTDTTGPEVGGKLFISCDSLNFSGGEYDPKIDGSNVSNPNADLLEIGGSSDGALKLTGATVNVTVLNPPLAGAVAWTVVKYKSRSGTFNNGTLNGTVVEYPDKNEVDVLKST